MLVVRFYDGLEKVEFVTWNSFQSESSIRRVVEEASTLTRRGQFLELSNKLDNKHTVLRSPLSRLCSSVSGPIEAK